jgi:hypothetical protein
LKHHRHRDIISLTTTAAQSYPGRSPTHSKQLIMPANMDAAKCKQLIQRRGVVKASLSRMQTFIESGDRKTHKIHVRFDDLPSIFNKYETVQSELELSDDIDHSDDRQFELQYYEVKAKFQ